MTNCILVLGGNGKTGRRVVERLRRANHDVRPGSRAGAPPFDWDDRTTWGPALRGVGAAYVSYQPDLTFSGAVDAVGAFAREAAAAGVGRLVLLSGRGEPEARLAEEAVAAAGADWSVVRASYFMQNFSEAAFADGVRAGEIVFPAGETPEPFVDAEDIADVAVAALTQEGHAGRVHEVTGPRLLTFADAAAQIAAATGREVRYVAVTPQVYRERLVADGLPEDAAATLTNLFTTTLDGRNAYVTGDVRAALGREPRDFADFARGTAESGAWS
jgi:uncharacterized protein YbjT (DUF2867 family)